ncbi:MAG: hypothetical protein GY714_20790 [Desulfobacterales bacterium]|nr:hypothetical protein [Desulfobacterales bacterium]
MIYCPKGHDMTEVMKSTLYPKYFYCHHCKEIYVTALTKIVKDVMDREYCTDRYGELVRLAEIIKAKKRVKVKDLVKLGYLDKSYLEK